MSRDVRFPPHEDVMEAIIGGMDPDGPDESGVSIRHRVTAVFELPDELIKARTPAGSVIWSQLIATALVSLRGAQIEGPKGGPYHLTAIGRHVNAQIMEGVPEIDEDVLLDIITEPGTDWLERLER